MFMSIGSRTVARLALLVVASATASASAQALAPAPAAPAAVEQPPNVPDNELKVGSTEWLPDRFLDADVLPIGDATFDLRDEGGEAFRAVRIYRLSQRIGKPHLYVAWPVPVLHRNPKPIPGMPPVVFAATPAREDPQITRVLLRVQLTTRELLAACKKTVLEQDRAYLDKHQVKDERVIVQSFPFGHAFIQFQIGGEDVFVAQTGVLAAANETTEFWVGLTSAQLKELGDAVDAGTLGMIWTAQYKGVGPKISGQIEARMTKKVVVDASARLSADQQAGKAPVFRQEDRDEVARRAMGSIRRSLVADHPDVVPMLNIDAMLPALFESWAIDGVELEALLRDENAAKAMAEYLKPHLETFKKAETRNQVTIKKREKEAAETTTGGGGFGLSIGPLSLGGGADTADTERTRESFEQATGVATERIGTSQWYRPVSIKTHRLKQYDDDADVLISDSVYITKGDQARYVQDTPISARRRAGNIADPTIVASLRQDQIEKSKRDTNRLERWRHQAQILNQEWNRAKPIMPSERQWEWKRLDLSPDPTLLNVEVLYSFNQLAFDRNLEGQRPRSAWYSVDLFVKGLGIRGAGIEAATKSLNGGPERPLEPAQHQNGSADSIYRLFSSGRSFSDEAASRGANDPGSGIAVITLASQHEIEFVMNEAASARIDGSTFKLKNLDPGNWEVRGRGRLFDPENPPTQFK